MALHLDPNAIAFHGLFGHAQCFTLTILHIVPVKLLKKKSQTPRISKLCLEELLANPFWNGCIYETREGKETELEIMH